MKLAPLRLLQHLKHSLGVQVICCALLMLVSGVVGFRMGSPHSAYAAGGGQGIDPMQSAQTAPLKTAWPQSVKTSQPVALTIPIADSGPASSSSWPVGPVADTPGTAHVSNSGVVGMSAPVNASAGQSFTASSRNSQTTGATATRTAAPPEIKIPLVFSAVNAAALGLSNQELAGIERLRSSFTNAVGQSSDPTDPAYANRWAEAQPNADDKLRAMLGWGRFSSYQLQAQRSK